MGLEDTYPGKVKWWINEIGPHPPIPKIYHVRVYVGDIARAGLGDFAFGEGLGTTEAEAREAAEAAVAAELIRTSKDGP